MPDLFQKPSDELITTAGLLYDKLFELLDPGLASLIRGMNQAYTCS